MNWWVSLLECVHVCTANKRCVPYLIPSTTPTSLRSSFKNTIVQERNSCCMLLVDLQTLPWHPPRLQSSMAVHLSRAHPWKWCQHRLTLEKLLRTCLAFMMGSWTAMTNFDCVVWCCQLLYSTFFLSSFLSVHATFFVTCMFMFINFMAILNLVHLQSYLLFRLLRISYYYVSCTICILCVVLTIYRFPQLYTWLTVWH